MTNKELMLVELQSIAGGIVHPVFGEYRKNAPTDKSIGIYKDDIFAGPIRLIDGSQKLRSGKFEVEPESKQWLQMLG